jgi:hypothetical protein
MEQGLWQSEPYRDRETYKIQGLFAVLEAGEKMKVKTSMYNEPFIDVEAVVKPEPLMIGEGKESLHEWKQRIYEEQKRLNYTRLDEMISRLERELAEESR